MNKKKIFTYLFIGLLAAGATGTVTSCKDYDDDINNLQDQIDKAALKSDVEALKTQLSSVESTANAAQTKAEKNATDILAKADKSYVDGVKTTAENAAATAAKAVTDAANAQATADEAKTLADAAKTLANTANDAAVKNAGDITKINAALTELQNKINNLGTADEITKAINAAKDEIASKYATKEDLTKAQKDASDALNSIASLKAEAATAKALKDSCAALETKITAATEAQVAPLKTAVEAYKASVDQLFSALTGVELFATYSGTGLNMNDISSTTLKMMHGLVPEDSKFGDNEGRLAVAADGTADPIIPFVKGSDIKSDGGVVVKVNPVNVDITKATVKLINSKGEVLDVVEAGTPVPVKDMLITRASANTGNGLWKIPFTVKDGTTDKAFNKATTTTVKDANGNDKPAEILYAVAICNTDSASDRYVSSTYDLGTKYEAYTPAGNLDYTVNDKPVAEIHNRWNGTETKSENAPLTKDIKEYTWQKDIPATTAITEGDKMNVAVDASDARWDKDLLHVEVGQAFTIKLANDKAKYYYVTLDENRAIESAPSELNAWKSYSYDGLKKNVSASSELSLKVNSAAANGDIIGFRVFAVNYDGTLQDPDGRAFYVQVGDAANAESVKGNINVTLANANIAGAGSLADKDGNVTAKGNYVDIALTKTFLSSTDALSGALNLDDATKDNLTSGSVYYTLLDENKKAARNWDKAKYVRVGVNEPSAWTDGTSLSGTVKAMEAKTATTAEYIKNSLTITVTKVLPQADDTKLSFRPKQEDVEGSGSFTMYLVPEGGSWNATPVKDNGTGNFDNVFYGLDPRITFTVDAAKYDKDQKVVALEDIKGTLIPQLSA